MIPAYDPILDRYADEIRADEAQLQVSNAFRFHPGVPMRPDPSNVTRPIRTDRRGMPHAATSLIPQPLPKRPHRGCKTIGWGGPADIRALRDPDNREALELLYWSQGKPALPTPVKPARERTPDVSEMTLEQLEATQYDEIPSSSKLCYEETGEGVLSLDLTKDLGESESGTLADVVADDHWLRDAYPTAFDAEEPDVELAKHVYDLWLEGEAMAKRYGNAVTHHTHISPEVRNRIEWERFQAQCSDATREGMRRQPNGTYSFYSLVGRRLTADEFQQRKAAYAEAFLARTGREKFPSAADIDRKRAIMRSPEVQSQLRRLARTGDAVSKALLALDNQRMGAMDNDAATTYQAVDTPYLPEMGLFLYRVRKADEANKPEYGTSAYRRWLDRTAMEAAAQWAEWVAEHADEPPSIILRGRPSKGPDSLWHREDWLQRGIDWVRKVTSANAAIGHHPVK